MENNDRVIKNLDYGKKVMAEEVLHKNPQAKILPPQPAPDVLPAIEQMVPILHKTCSEIAFYYTHVPAKGEMMMSTHACNADGKRIERGAPMTCTSCGELIEGASYLQVRMSDLKKKFEESR